MLTSSYKVQEPRQYVIHDRPDDDLPIRRLQVEGADVLHVNDLLQIALGRVDNFDQLTQEYGAQFLTTLHTVPEIVETLHLDHIQATRLLAILALGKRLYSPSQGSLPIVRGAEDVFKYHRSLSALAKEQFRVLLINSRYQLIHEELVAVGSIDSLSISPRDIFQPAVERRVNAIILVHNHPSGDPTPSASDLEFTQTIKEAGELLGIELLDHIIIGQDSYFSCLKS
jgi:DNA repair protein RadC